MAFNGYPADGMKFLGRLKRNNKREWFKPRKEEFVETVYNPLMELVAEFKKQYGSQLPELWIEPKKSIYRIYRDTRFSNDKTPYKTHIGAFLPWRGTSKTDPEAPGIYIQINPDGGLIAGGTYAPSNVTLRKIRESIVRDSENFLEMLEDPKFKKRFGGFEGEKLKIAPQGTDPNHPMIKYLRHKQFYFVRNLTKEELQSKKLIKILGEDTLKMMPMTRWLNKAAHLW